MIQSMMYDSTNRLEKRLVPDAMLDPNTGYGSRKNCTERILRNTQCWIKIIIEEQECRREEGKYDCLVLRY